MKSTINNPISSFVILALKLVGLILILSFLLDLIILFFPWEINQRGWQINFVTQIVDRGVTPIVGLGFLFAGYWMNDSVREPINNRKSWLSLRLWTLLLSCILGVMFFVLSPLHFNNVRLERDRAIGKINQEATLAQNQLQAELNSPQAKAQIADKQNQFRSEVNQLLQNEQQINQLPEDQKKLLQQFKANPQALDQFLNQRFGTQILQEQGIKQIQARKEQAEQQAIQDAWKSGLRTGIRSLLLAIGYMMIGWLGLRNAIV